MQVHKENSETAGVSSIDINARHGFGQSHCVLPDLCSVNPCRIEVPALCGYAQLLLGIEARDVRACPGEDWVICCSYAQEDLEYRYWARCSALLLPLRRAPCTRAIVVGVSSEEGCVLGHSRFTVLVPPPT